MSNKMQVRCYGLHNSVNVKKIKHVAITCKSMKVIANTGKN